MAGSAKPILAGLLALPLVAGLAALRLGPTPPSYAISLLAFPLGLLGAGILLARRGDGATLDAWARRLLTGAGAGFVATLSYDGYRMAIHHGLAIPFDPFRVQPVFGQIFTGLPTTHPFSLVVGWSYHLWLGVLLGMVFSALRPRGGLLEGGLFAAVLQLGRWAMYPSVFKAGLTDHEFFANGVVGQLFWGGVLGLTVWGLHRVLVGNVAGADRPS